MAHEDPYQRPYDHLEARKATKSGTEEACVRVRIDADGYVFVSDDKRPELPPFAYSPVEWDAFQDGVRKHEFDLPTV